MVDVRRDSYPWPIVPQGHRHEPTTVGDDVWISANTAGTPGVSISTGTAVVASTGVIRSTEPYSIVADVPARVIGD